MGALLTNGTLFWDAWHVYIKEIKYYRDLQNLKRKRNIDTYIRQPCFS